MIDGYKIIDADCHLIEPDSVWTDFIDPSYRSRAPRREEIDGRTELCAEGETLRQTESGYAYTPGYDAILSEASKRFDSARQEGFSPAARIRDMDAVGVDIQILNPTIGGRVLGRIYKDTGLLAACCSAYNDWCVEYCSSEPDRLKWVAMLPLQDPALAVKEVERAAGSGACAFLFRPNPIHGRNIFHKDYFPVFEAIESLDRPFCVHDTGSPRLPSYADRMETHTTGHIIAHPFETMSAMMGLIWYGVFEEFPKLSVVHVEGDAGWIPYWLQRMEQHWDFTGNAEHPYLSMRPTEYFKRNVFVAARGDETTLPGVIEQVGDDNLLFNTDYPHSDGSYPWGVKSLLEQPITDASRRKLLWENPRRAFRLEG